MSKIMLAGIAVFALLAGVAQPVSAELRVDFNSTTQDDGPHNLEGWQAYDAAHEDSASFVTQDYEVNFPIAGASTISVTPDWPNTTDARVRQAIDRSPGNDANWVGNDLDLLTDWIGIDSRTQNGGNGDWNRVDNDPTYMTLTLSGLPAGDYIWISYHHDTENMWSDFQIEISTDGGATYGPAVDLQSTDSTDGGNPESAMRFKGDVNPDPRSLPSTYSTVISANGTDDVVIRFAPFADGVDPVAVHKQFFLINGFKVIEFPDVQVPAMSTWGLVGFTTLALAVGAFVVRRRRPLPSAA